MSGVLQIVEYDGTWPAAFQEERARIAHALGALARRIDHHGSTSVPGLAAKPVIDIQVSVRRLRPMEAYRTALEAIGYLHRSHPDDAFAPFFHRPASWPHTHHVHAVEAGGTPERETLAFRDFLRVHPEAAQRYAALKRELAPRFVSDDFASRQAYAEAKGALIRELTARALAEGHPRSLPAPWRPEQSR